MVWCQKSSAEHLIDRIFGFSLRTSHNQGDDIWKFALILSLDLTAEKHFNKLPVAYFKLLRDSAYALYWREAE